MRSLFSSWEATFTCVGWEATATPFGRYCTHAQHKNHAQRHHNGAHARSGAMAISVLGFENKCGAAVFILLAVDRGGQEKNMRDIHSLITPQRVQRHRAQMLSPAVRVCRPLCVRCLLCVCCLLCGVARSACVLCCNPLLLLCSPKKKVRPADSCSLKSSHVL